MKTQNPVRITNENVAGLLEEQERYIKEHSMLNILLR